MDWRSCLLFDKARRLLTLVPNPLGRGRSSPSGRWADAVQAPQTFDLERHVNHELALDLMDGLAEDPSSVRGLASFIAAGTWPLRHRAARADQCAGSYGTLGSSTVTCTRRR